jgi:hypothetical protein
MSKRELDDAGAAARALVKWLRCIVRGGHLFAPAGVCVVCGAPADGPNLLDVIEEGTIDSIEREPERAETSDDAEEP